MMYCVIVVNGENIKYDDFRIGNDEETMSDQWAEQAKGLLKAELKRTRS